jgi:hypothetical protein
MHWGPNGMIDTDGLRLSNIDVEIHLYIKIIPDPLSGASAESLPRKLNSTLLNFVSGAEKNEKRTKKEGRNESYEGPFSVFSANVTKWN